MTQHTPPTTKSDGADAAKPDNPSKIDDDTGTADGKIDDAPIDDAADTAPCNDAAGNDTDAAATQHDTAVAASPPIPIRDETPDALCDDDDELNMLPPGDDDNHELSDTLPWGLGLDDDADRQHHSDPEDMFVFVL